VTDFYDPLYGQIVIPPPYMPIVDSPAFRRLQYLRQLGLCYLSFPGGNHTRFEHSLGAFHLAGFIGQTFEKSKVIDAYERNRLVHMLRLAALCHDIGHGPFSHMSENVLLGLGASVTHEEMGAAVLIHHLSYAFEPFKDFNITPELIGSLITHTPTSDRMAGWVADLISSDFDVDRLDYLQRDAHYAGYRHNISINPAELEDVWNLNLSNRSFYPELTEDGVRYAEGVLLLRRVNYQRIVFESRHMSATGMFEKALYFAFQSLTHFGNLLRTIVATHVDWKAPKEVKDTLPTLLEVYGMVDYEALKRIEESHSDARYLITRIRRGSLFNSLARWSWVKLHYLVKHRLMALKGASQNFQFRRGLEIFLARTAGVDSKHVIVRVPEIRLPKPLLLGVQGGGTLTDNSELGRFLHDDFLRQYAVEIFIDPQVDERTRSVVLNTAVNVFERGFLEIEEFGEG